MTFEVQSVTNYSITGTALIDVDATAGSAALTVTSGPQGGATVTSLVGTVTVTARTAIALTAGSAATGSVAAPLDSTLYTFTPTATAPDVEVVGAATADANATPSLILLPASGHFADLISVSASADTINGTTGAARALHLLGQHRRVCLQLHRDAERHSRWHTRSRFGVHRG